jgi:hypothetical protein
MCDGSGEIAFSPDNKPTAMTQVCQVSVYGHARVELIDGKLQLLLDDQPISDRLTAQSKGIEWNAGDLGEAVVTISIRQP